MSTITRLIEKHDSFSKWLKEVHRELDAIDARPSRHTSNSQNARTIDKLPSLSILERAEKDHDIENEVKTGQW